MDDVIFAAMTSKSSARDSIPSSQINTFTAHLGGARRPVEGERRPWRPSALIRLSYVAHLGAFATMVADPSLLPWALSGLAANHLFLGFEGLRPRSRLLGYNLSRLPESARSAGLVAITFDDGPDPEVTPRVLDLLDSYRACASFFCIGERVAQNPDLAREIVRRGHALENHSQHHLHRFAFLGPGDMRRELVDAQAELFGVSGRPPRFFRAVAGLRNPFLEPELCRAGLRLVSWTRRGFDTLDGDPQRVVDRLCKNLRAGDILICHDGNSARTRNGAPVVLETLPKVLDKLAQMGLRTARLDSLILDE